MTSTRTRAPSAQFGHNRDGQRDKLQIVFGLLCTAEGCPIAVEVFEGQTGHPTTLAPQVKKLRERFGVASRRRRPRPADGRAHPRGSPACGVGLDHGAPGLGDPAPGRARCAPALVVRRARPGRDCVPGLSGGAAHRVSQSAARRGADAQTGGPLARDGRGALPKTA